MGAFSFLHDGGDVDLGIEPLDDLGAVFLAELNLIFRGRHLVTGEGSYDVDPPIGIWSVDEIGVEFINPEVSFFFLGSVAGEAGV